MNPLALLLPAILAAFKVNPKRALDIVLRAIGVLTVALTLLQEVAKALAGQ